MQSHIFSRATSFIWSCVCGWMILFRSNNKSPLAMFLVPTKFWGKVWLLSCQMFHQVHQQVSGCVRLLSDAEQVVDDVFFKICLLKLLWPKMMLWECWDWTKNKLWPMNLELSWTEKFDDNFLNYNDFFNYFTPHKAFHDISVY